VIENADLTIAIEPPKVHKKTNSIHIKTEALSRDSPTASAETMSSPVSIDSVADQNMNIDTVEPVQKERTIKISQRSPSPPPPTLPPPPPSKPKHKKVDSVTAEELKKCRRIMNKLTKSSSALPFTEPVDEVLDGAPGYYKMIT
jgi:transcription initiation factor TFIID subunit 2